MPTTAELNAGFDALQADLELIVAQFVPPFFQGNAREKLESAQGRQLILDGVAKVLRAAEKARGA
jgi:hypothetical protein